MQNKSSDKKTIAIVGATGWLGTHVVKELADRDYTIYSLARLTSTTEPISNYCKIIYGDVTDPYSLEGLFTEQVDCVISCLGLENLALYESDMDRVLKDGTLAVFNWAKKKHVKQFIMVAGGMHKTKDGTIDSSLIHNKVREKAIRIIKQECVRSGLKYTIIDPSVFFKDAEMLFKMVGKSKGRLALIGRGWDVKCNPISGNDLAKFICDSIGKPELLNKRVSVGGPTTMTLKELISKAAFFQNKTIKFHKLPVLASKVAIHAIGLTTVLSPKLMGLYRFLQFILIVSVDPTGDLSGDSYGEKSIDGYYKNISKTQHN